MPKVGKPISKRTSTRLRNSIQKKSAEKQRKLRKQAKNNPEWRSKIKKDPGIPNLFPFKQKVLDEIEESKRRKEEEKQRARLLAKARREGIDVKDIDQTAAADDDEDLDLSDMDDDDAMDEDASNPMAALLASARARAQDFDGEAEEDEDEMDEDMSDDDDAGEDQTMNGSAVRKDSSRRAFDKVFKNVIEQADVVLYVLDARDPNGTRSKEVERQIMAAEAGHNKRLILVLNKIDLIPAQVLKDWLIHLRRSFPTLPLRAANSAANARTFDHKALTVKGTSETLFRALKTYAHSSQLKRAITVGVIGYPNVGKSSVINALTSQLGKKGNCPTGAEAGVTTSLREVKIDSKLKLLDSPGIVFPSSAEGQKANRTEEQARLILLNAVPPKEIDDPVPAVTLLLKRLSASPDGFQKMLDVYGLPALMVANGDLTTNFLVQVARKRGRLGKGGVPNIHAAAQTVVTDWRDGRIQGWMDAPTLKLAKEGKKTPGNSDSEGLVGDQKEIVTEWAKEFKLEGLWGDANDDTAMES
ncbi:hypothetical protein E4T50_14023 [Aureobasidium sp. EXF-12298]|nr:hypothetical protein E4T50_14023 [Aureobasidium sp. EXF-12298]